MFPVIVLIFIEAFFTQSQRFFQSCCAGRIVLKGSRRKKVIRPARSGSTEIEIFGKLPRMLIATVVVGATAFFIGPCFDHPDVPMPPQLFCQATLPLGSLRLSHSNETDSENS